MKVSSARGVVASGTSRMLDGCPVLPCIMIAYGHTPTCSVLRGRRAAELLAGGGAARSHATGGEPADPFAREAARAAAPRPLRAASRADGGRTAAVPERAAAARARGAAARRARRGGRGRARRAPRDRRVDGPRWDGHAGGARRVPAAPP